MLKLNCPLFLATKEVEQATKQAKQAEQKGMQKEKQTVVLNMLKEQADMQFICKVTGLSQDEIKKLKNGA